MKRRDVLFDVDSTLVEIEGLDYLAERKGLKDKLAPLTVQAMNGTLSMREAMVQKMDALRPSALDLEFMGHAYLQHVVLGVLETIEEIHRLGHRAWILTGNFQQAAELLASGIGIPRNRVLANQVILNDRGEYVGINPDLPLFNNHGKVVTITNNSHRLHNITMVGDGSTDAETKPVVDLFIGYGGVARRKAVEKTAEVYIKDRDLRKILPYLQTR